jgi:hypothetical protein
MADEQIEQSEADPAKSGETLPERKPLTVPSPDPATNLLIADIVLRSASKLFQKRVEQQVARKSTGDEDQAKQLLDGRGIIRTLTLYGASKIATRSPAGLGVVAGGLALKTLYDRGKARRKRLRKNNDGAE